MLNPSFSICIPNYNYGKYIGKAIESVLFQEYGNFEIIISDNCSSDDSIDVIESYNDARLKLIKNNYNIGYSANLTKVTSFARNDFLIFLPSDDFLRPGALKDCALIISRYKEEIDNLILSFQIEQINEGDENTFSSVSNLPYFNKYKNKYTLNEIRAECFEYSGKDIHKIMFEKIQMPFMIQSMIFSRKLFERGEGANALRFIGPDKFLCLKMLSFNPKVVCVEKPISCFNYHGSPMAQAQLTNLKQQIDDYIYTLDFSPEDFEKFGTSKYKITREFLDNRCLKVGLTQLVYGSYLQSFKIFCFCFASYPLEAMKRPRTWVLFFLLILGPFAKIISLPLYYFYRKFL